MKTIKLLKRILHKHSSIVLSSSSSLQTKTTNSLPKLITNKNNKLNNNNNNNNNNSFDNNDFDYNNNNNNFDNNNKSNDNFDKFDNNNVLLKLFITGSTIGPLVDSIHNQCLLTYNKLPIQIEWPIIFYDNVIVPFNNYNSENNNNVNYLFNNYLFTSSWYVPLLLGFAYIVLGYLLPYIIQNGVNNIVMFISNNNNNQTSNNDNNTNNIQIFMNKFLGIQTIKPKETTTAIITKNDKNNQNYNIINETNDDDDNNYDFKNLSIIRTKAILAVLSTAFIIKFSEFLVLNPNYFLMNDTINNNNNNPINVILQSFINSSNNDQTVEQFNLLLLFIVTIIQWLLLDCTLTSLITASIVSIFGPLSEIPFISLNIWSYLPNVIDKLPLLTYNNDSIINPILIQLFGINYQELGISSISAPCYFAVTMDAIALKRWFSFSTK